MVCEFPNSLRLEEGMGVSLPFSQAPKIGPGRVVSPLASPQNEEDGDVNGRDSGNGDQRRHHAFSLLAFPLQKGGYVASNSPDNEAGVVSASVPVTLALILAVICCCLSYPLAGIDSQLLLWSSINAQLRTIELFGNTAVPRAVWGEDIRLRDADESRAKQTQAKEVEARA